MSDPSRPPRPYVPADIRRQVVLEEHEVAPDGSWAIVVRRHVAGDTYRSHLWLVPLDGSGPARPLTAGAVRDTRPRIRPDGRAVAFRRTASSEPEPPGGHVRRLHVLPLAADGRPTGEPVAVSPERPSVGELAWAPDGRSLAYTAEADPPRFIVGPDPTGDDAPRARRIRRTDWRYDEAGHVDRWEHLFVIPARRGARPIRLTSGDWGVSEIAWAPDGRSVAFSADRRPDADLLPRPSIWAVPSAGGEPTEVLALGGPAGHPAYSPDGRWLAAVGVVDADALDDVAPEIVVGPADGSAAARPLAPELDRPIGTWHDADLNGWMDAGQVLPVWEPDGRALVALVGDRGRTLPWRFPVDPETGRSAGRPTPLLDGPDAEAVGWSIRVDGSGRLTTLSLVGTRAQELYAVAPGPSGGRLRRATAIGAAWQRGRLVPEVERLQAPGDGGPIETLVVSPPGAGTGALPAVVDIHGGPLGAWTTTPPLEALMLVSAGYRVILPNIRGSATYGRDWIRPQLGDWGGVDAADVHRAIDAVIAAGLADPARLGVLGLSYGGFMVNWLVGTTDRFRAAVSENGVANQVAAWALSDTGPEYCRTSLLGDPFTPEGVEKLWRQSPLRNVARIRTPLLILQAEADRRCPAADNEQLFVALRQLGREVEYVLYPDEYHVYATTGRPDRRIDRMTRVLDWFDRHLRA